MANTGDLRYMRTEDAIREAFMALAAELPVSSASASELCRRAGISRNAFYLHYANVPTLFTTLVGEIVEDVRAEGLASSERRAASGQDGWGRNCQGACMLQRLLATVRFGGRAGQWCRRASAG